MMLILPLLILFLLRIIFSMFLHQERTAWRKRAEVAHRHVGQWKVDGTIMPAKKHYRLL